TRTEFGMLATLARHAGDTVDRETLMRGAYPRRRVVSDRTIDSHIRRLREKLRAAGADPIRTMHGVGYRLSWDNRMGVP
ncbi:MAG: winged helix-turn-helix domain-containing protein, partial [Gammaproteobacteria bacterium]|nr:winged helix-turn-helix domain-containing protein [Gammaproteobacteria bacterium]